MTDAFHDYPDRRAVPWPALSRPDRINTATIGTAIALQIHQSFVSVKTNPHIAMPPDPVAPAPLLQASCRARTHIVAATLQYLLDTNHEKKRQYPVPSRKGGGYVPSKTRLLLPGPFLFI